MFYLFFLLQSAYTALLPTEQQMHLTSQAAKHNWDRDLKAMEARQRWCELANLREGRMRHPRTKKFTRAELREIERLGH
jgi:hypothetical protein